MSVNIAEIIKQLTFDLNKIYAQANQVSSKIESALTKKENPKISNKETMDIYNAIYDVIEKGTEPQMNLSLDNKQKKQQLDVEEKLFEFYEKLIKSFIQKMNETLKQIEIDQNEEILTCFLQQFEDFKIYVHWLFKLFQYLDQFYTKKKQSNLYSQALKKLKIDYFEVQKEKFQQVIFHFFNKVRQYHLQQPPINLKKLIDLFSEITYEKVVFKKYEKDGEFIFENQNKSRLNSQKYYQEHFEGPYIKELSKFYSKKQAEWINLSLPEYVSKVQESLDLEENLIQNFYRESRKAIINKLEIILIKETGSTLIDNPQSGISLMLNLEKHDQLNKAFLLLKRVPDMLPLISKKFISYIENLGKSINVNENQNPQGQKAQKQQHPAELYIESILNLMVKAENLVQVVFEQDMEMQKAYNTAFTQILNQNDKSPFYLAIFCDIFFKSDKFATDADFNKRMDQIFQVFRYIFQRDVFFKHYQKLMSIRLLNGQSKNRDTEKQLIYKFKGESGTNAITNIQIMLNDINLSVDFHQFVQKDLTKIASYDFSVMILTSGCWPLGNIISSVNAPYQMEQPLEFYKDKFLNKYSGRQITWVYNAGIGEVVYRTSKDKYFLVLNTMQIISFMQFNKINSQTVQEMMKKTNMSKNELEIALIPLVMFKILTRKKEAQEDFDDEEVLEINEGFSQKSKKLRLLPNPKLGPKKQNDQNAAQNEDNAQMEQIIKEREFVVDSHLVRLMKSRKEMKHSELVQDCLKMINVFVPDVNFIKKRIESLIEREYIRRDEVDWNKYSYIN